MTYTPQSKEALISSIAGFKVTIIILGLVDHLCLRLCIISGRGLFAAAKRRVANWWSQATVAFRPHNKQDEEGVK